MKKYEKNMNKYEENTKKGEEYMKNYEGIRKIYEEICWKYKETHENKNSSYIWAVGLGKIPSSLSLGQGGGVAVSRFRGTSKKEI